MKEVARRAGVSTATVSRVISGTTVVSRELRERVQAAIDELDYRPSRVARSLRTHRAKILGVIVSDIRNPYFTAVVRGIEDVANANAHSLLLCNSDEDAAKEELYIQVLLAERVAGVIISPTDEDSTTCRALVESRIPVVAVDRRLRRVDADMVIVDNVKGASQAVSHLARLGHRRIASIGGPTHISTGRERLEGYKKALVDHGIAVDESLIKIGDFKQDSGYRLAHELLSLENPPGAVFVANNLMTLGALCAIHERGLNIPRDVAIVGFDDMPWATSLAPPLTAVAQPTYELGSTAADLLLQRIADRERPLVEMTLEPNLVVRASCGQAERSGQSVGAYCGA
jgi:DNA-binding LacI/PurR family transcriptional regulator